MAMKCNSNDNRSELFSISNQVWFKFVLIYVLFFNRGRMFFIPSICFALHTTLALRALDDLSIPMYVSK